MAGSDKMNKKETTSQIPDSVCLKTSLFTGLDLEVVNSIIILHQSLHLRQ